MSVRNHASTKQSYCEITKEDFAEIFGCSIEELPEDCVRIIESSNFRYVELSEAEKETVYLRVLKTLLSDSMKISGPHRQQDWEKGWSENLNSYEMNGHDLKELIPKFVRQNEVIRFRGRYILPADASFETNFVIVLRYYLFSKYFCDVSKVCEFGCGTGLNLLAVSKLFPEKRLLGLDWAQASCDIVNKLSERLNLDMRGILFDMFRPDENVDIVGNSAVFTIGAMEQLGTNFGLFLDFLMKKRPKVCINIETLYEMLNMDLLYDYVAGRYLEKRNYLRGYLKRLRELERQGQLDILEVRETFGCLYHNGYTYVVWRPKV